MIQGPEQFSPAHQELPIMASYEVKADWRAVDVDTLTDDLAAAHELYREANRQAQQAREAFETAFRAAVPCPRGQRLAFGYRFGKLSIAVIPDDKPKATSAGRGALTMSDLLASRGVRAI
jgi:hypothetical protein